MHPKRLSAARSVFLQPEQLFVYGIENALPRGNPLSFARGYAASFDHRAKGHAENSHEDYLVHSVQRNGSHHDEADQQQRDQQS